MMQNLTHNWLVVLKLTWGMWRILTWALKSLKNLHFNGFLWNKVYNVWAEKVKKSCLGLHWKLMQNLNEIWLVPSNITWEIWQTFTDWKIPISFLEIKMAKLNQNKNSKQMDRQDAVGKLYVILDINT